MLLPWHPISHWLARDWTPSREEGQGCSEKKVPMSSPPSGISERQHHFSLRLECLEQPAVSGTHHPRSAFACVQRAATAQLDECSNRWLSRQVPASFSLLLFCKSCVSLSYPPKFESFSLVFQRVRAFKGTTPSTAESCLAQLPTVLQRGDVLAWPPAMRKFCPRPSLCSSPAQRLTGGSQFAEDSGFRVSKGGRVLGANLITSSFTCSTHRLKHRKRLGT